MWSSTAFSLISLLVTFVTGILSFIMIFRIYKTFKGVYNGQIHSETKQILSYISLFAAQNILNACIFGVVLLNQDLLSLVLTITLGEISAILSGILVIFYLAMIHIYNFEKPANELTTSLGETEDNVELDDSFEENFQKLFLLGRDAQRSRANSNHITNSGDDEIGISDNEMKIPIMVETQSLQTPVTNILETTE